MSVPLIVSALLPNPILVYPSIRFCVNLGGKYLLKAFSFYLTINTLINIKKL